MKKIHKYLTRKLFWYQKWHGLSFHGVFHWLAFIIITIAIEGNIVSAINESLFISQPAAPEAPANIATTGSIRFNLDRVAAKSSFPDVSFPQSFHSDDAIKALGDKLPDVAAWYGYTPEQLKDYLKKDKTLWVDSKGRLNYRDEILPENVAGGDLAQVSGSAILVSYPLDQAFFMHSNPNSKKVIYLNFAGGTIRAGQSVWADRYNNGLDIIAPAWDIDGNRAVFGDTERARIQEIWRRVSEDFAPYDVDVTTEQPSADRIERSSSSDQIYGNMVLLSPISTLLGLGSYGGYSYLRVYDNVGEYYKISMCFPEKLANGEKYMAECASHEMGHAVGLHHEGTTGGIIYYQGQGNWAPIMGNSYYRNVTQWAKGEYANANNTEDQLQVMQNYGLVYYPDDHGNTAFTATLLSGSTIHGWGVIERTIDIDVFKFVADAGPATLNIDPAPVSPNLDIQAFLKDSLGNIVASSDSQTSLSATISATVAGGTYYLFIEGVGNGSPLTTGYSDYDSLGQYTINGTVVYSGAQPPSAAASASPSSGPPPLLVQFLSNGSGDSDGIITSYSWNFGDGLSSGEANPAHTYSNTGIYTASLTVTDNSGLTDAKTLTISVSNQPPIARIVAVPTSGNLPLNVNFDGSASYDPDGTISDYNWTFGDGTTGSGPVIWHTYSAKGSYNAQLTVTDNNGAKSSTSVAITITDSNFIAAPSNLTGSVFGSVITLLWKDNSYNEEGFYVERALKAGRSTIFARVGQVGAGVNTYSESVAVGSYIYRVQAFNSSTVQVSAYSNTVQKQIKK